MFTDPQTVTVNAVAQTMPRTSMGQNQGVFSKDDGTIGLQFSHLLGKRNRRQIRLNFRKVAADPLLAGVNKEYTGTVYLVIDHPPVGFTNTELKQYVDAFTAYLTASSGANVTKVLGGES